MTECCKCGTEIPTRQRCIVARQGISTAAGQPATVANSDKVAVCDACWNGMGDD